MVEKPDCRSTWSLGHLPVNQSALTGIPKSFGKILTSAAIDRLKKCYVADPETNLGVPIELTATDVRPYFENQELLRRLSASEFAPHVFDKEQELPLALFSDRPRDDLPTTPAPIGETRLALDAPAPPQAVKPAEAPTAVPMHAELPAELAPPEVVALEPEPTVAKRGRGHPPGSKNKPRVCPNYTTSAACVVHSIKCKEGLACNLHTETQLCAKCTRTRLESTHNWV